MKHSAAIVVDLGFGDAGKGLVTDYLVRHTDADWVVRFNGGAQAGHNVVTADGRHHTFAQFGAGTFAGAQTWLGPEVIVHPSALVIEAAHLQKKGVVDPLSWVSIHEDATIVTPFHQAMNRIRECVRGPARHGSCGVGIGEAVHHRTLRPEDAIAARDLADHPQLRRKAKRIQAYLLAEAKTLPLAKNDREERAILHDPDILETWIAIVAQTSARVRDRAAFNASLRGARRIVFEGAQGVLLDQDYGFHPHTTWARCTPQPAIALAEDAGRSVETIGVLRSHAVRHGAGPLPTETPALEPLIREHNQANPWQGPVRYGWFDAVLTRYALAAGPGIDTLAVTHLDLVRPGHDLKACWRYASGPSIEVPAERTLDAQAALGRTLSTVRPVLEAMPHDPDAFADQIESRVGRPVGLRAFGPTAGDIQSNLGGAPPKHDT